MRGGERIVMWQRETPSLLCEAPPPFWVVLLRWGGGGGERERERGAESNESNAYILKIYQKRT